MAMTPEERNERRRMRKEAKRNGNRATPRGYRMLPAQRRKIEDELAKQQNGQPRRRRSTYGKAVSIDDPSEVLLQEISRTAGHVQWLGEQLRRCEPKEFMHSFWLRGRQSGWISRSELDTHKWSSAGAIWVELYMKERQHLANVCRTALAAGIEERRVRIAERMAERIYDRIRGMLYDLGLDPEDDRVRVVVFKWLSSADEEVNESTMAIEGP